MLIPDIFEVFSAVCSRDNGALRWGNPGPWVHAELFAELDRRSQRSDWVPLDCEVPYVTHYPVQLPKPANRDWKKDGAVKWIDLCLHSKDKSDWCWFEFKVRHVGELSRAQKSMKEARYAFVKDVVALIGFDIPLTSGCWQEADTYTKAYWFEAVLKPNVEQVRSGNHHFVTAFL